MPNLRPPLQARLSPFNRSTQSVSLRIEANGWNGAASQITSLVPPAGGWLLASEQDSSRVAADKTRPTGIKKLLLLKP